MKSTVTTRLGALALAGTGALHLALVPEYLEEAPYIGVLFIFGGIAAILIAAVIALRDDLRAWAGGAAIAAGMAVGFVLSRTTGLPGFHEAEWEASGILSLLLELGFVGLAASALGRRRQLAAT